MDKFMHLRWLLIIIWISHDILSIVSYFLFIIISLTCRLHARECWQTLQNIDFLSWPWIWRTSRSIFRYMFTFTKLLEVQLLVNSKLYRNLLSMGFDTGLMEKTGSIALSGCSWLAAPWPSLLFLSRMLTCRALSISAFTTFISTAGYRYVIRKWRKNLLVN